MTLERSDASAISTAALRRPSRGRSRALGMLAACAGGAALSILGFSGSAAAVQTTCSIYWTGTTNNTWGTQTNWSLTDGGGSAGRVPNATDLVCMSTAPARSTVNLASNASVEGIKWGQAGSVQPALTVTSGFTLTVGNANGVVASSIYNLTDSGTVTSFTGEALAVNSFSFNGTLLGPGSMTVSGPTSVADNAVVTLGAASKAAHLTTSGTTTIGNETETFFNKGSVFENQGTLTLSDDSELIDADGTATNEFLNDAAGTVSYAPTGVSSPEALIDVGAANNGSVSVTGSGTLNFGDDTSATVADAGTFSAGANSTIALYGTRQEGTGASFAGAGTVQVASNDTVVGTGVSSTATTFEVSGTLAVASGKTFTAANLVVANGQLVGPGAVTVTGSFSVPSGATLGVSGTPADAIHLTTQGASSIASDGQTLLYGGSVWENQGTLTLNDQSEIVDNDGNANNKLVNDASGTISYAGSAAGQEAYIEINAPNTGAVSVTQGSLDFGNDTSASSVTDAGSYSASAGTTLFIGGTRSFGSSTSFSGAGTIKITGTDTITTSTVTGSFEVDGTLIVASGKTFTAGNLVVNSGILEGPGAVTVTGSFSVPTSASLGVSGVTADAVHLTTQGASSIASDDEVLLYGGSVWENQGTLTLTDQSEIIDNDGNANNKLVNDASGTISYAGSAAGQEAYIEINAPNAGAVSVTQGTLDFGDDTSASSVTDAGSYSASAGTTLLIGGNRSFGSSTSFSGAGTIKITGTDTVTTSTVTGSFEVDGTLLVASGKTFTAGNLVVNGGTLEGPGAVRVTGSFSVSSSASFGVSGVAADAVHLTTQGASSIVSDDEVLLYDGSVWENQGTLTLTDQSQIIDNDGNANSKLVNDASGTISYAGSAAGQEAYVEINASNAGTVSVTKGTLDFGDDTSATVVDSGTFSASAGATLLLPGTRTFSASTAFTGAGTIKVTGTSTVTSSTVTGSFEVDGTLVVSSGQTFTAQSLTVNGGSLVGPGSVVVQGTLSVINSVQLGQASHPATALHLTTQGVSAIGSGAEPLFNAGSVWENQGSLSVADSTDFVDNDGAAGNLFQNDAAGIVSYAGSTANASAEFNVTTTNNGTFSSTKGKLIIPELTNESGAGALTGGTYIATGGTIGVPVGITSNSANVTVGTGGVIDVGGGSTNALTSLTSNSGSLSLGVALTDANAVTNSGTLTVNAIKFQPKSYTQSAGTTTVNTGGTLQGGSGAAGAIAINGGNLTGNGTISGPLSGTGTITPGRSSGPLSVASSYAPAATGTLAIGISGPSTVGTDFGQLAVTGAATLNGTLAITTANGYVPPLGTTYTILTAGSRTGTFSTVTGKNLADRQYQVTYGSGSVTLTVVQPPAITSNNSTTFKTGTAGTFTVTTTGFPTAAISDAAATLPSGVTFVDNGNGTATLTGTPANGTGGSYPFTITANNGVSPNATQNFTLTVNQPPAVTSANSVTFTTGSAGTFSVTTSGFPNAALSDGSATLPSGVTFVDNGNGTATLAGPPAAGTGGTYPFTITANNGILPNATQNFTLTVKQPPAVTSSNSTTFSAGAAGTFTVTTSGFPNAALSDGSATLPSGVTFVDNGNGTATLAGTPANGTGGNYPFTITASNGVSPNATQSFTLKVNQPPAVTSNNSTTFKVGNAGTFTVTTSGSPNAALSDGAASLPSGVTFVDNGNGTATLAGTPAAGTGGTYSFTITASNGVSPNATQNFTLTVNQAPAITSANATTIELGTAGSFTVTTTGFPNAALSDGGASLPSGVTFVDNGNGTATLAGTPAAGTGGSYPFTITANNGVSPNATQSFTLTVDPGLTVTAVNPNALGQSASVPVTITGAGFTSGAALTASGTGVKFTAVSVTDATHISATATVTATAATTARTITLTEPTGTATCTNCLTVDAAPAVTSLTPPSLPQGATSTVTIAGSHFQTGATLAFLGSPPVVHGTVTTATATSLTTTVTVLATTPTGSYDLRVTNPDGGKVTCAGCFTVSAAPTVAGINPAAIGVGGSLPFTLTGTAIESGATLTFTGPGAGVRATIATVTPTSISGTLIAGTTAKTGTYTAHLTNPDGSKATCTNCLTVDAAPTVTALSPSTFGQHATNVPVTITGTGFVSGATVTFTGPGTGVHATVSTVTATSMSVLLTTPANATVGHYTIRVTNVDGGKGTLNPALTVVAGPTITSINPSSVAPNQVTPVTITGTGFSSDATVKGAAGLTFTNVSVNGAGTQITATLKVPKSAKATNNVAITVTNGPIGNYGSAVNSTETIT